MILTKASYRAVDSLPRDERFGLISQIRRSATSVPSNIAEGCGRNTRRELTYFIGVAIGSVCELETQIELAHDLYGISDISTLFEGLHETKAKLLRFRTAVQHQVDRDGR